MGSLTNVPALTPPAGVIPNYVNPYSLYPFLVATITICLALATFAVAIRLATSFCAFESIRVEDYTSLIAWLGLLATCTLTLLEAHEGMGRHQWDVPLSHLLKIKKLLYANRIFYSPTILAAKLTVLFQLMRIFVPTKRGGVYWSLQALIVLNVGFYFANDVSVIFQCDPVPKAWDSNIPGTCVNTNLNFIVTGVTNVVSDLLILLLPIWAIWHLQIPLPKKLGVSSVFMMGVFANVAGIMRLYLSTELLNTADLNFVRMQHGMWTMAEITTVIICGTLPIMPRFLRLFRTKSASATASGSPGNQYYGSHTRQKCFSARATPQNTADAWSAEQTNTALAKVDKAYVPLKENNSSAASTESTAGKHNATIHLREFDGGDEEGDDRRIWKTVRVEQSFLRTD